MKKGRIFFIAVVVVVAIGLVLAFVALNRNAPAGLESDQPPLKISAAELVDAFINDEVRADSVYGGKVLEVHGRLRRIINDEGTRIWLIGDSGSHVHVHCYMDGNNIHDGAPIRAGTDVRVTGVCNGMLGDVVLDKAIGVINE